MSFEVAPNAKIIEMISTNQVDLGFFTNRLTIQLLQQKLGEDAMWLVVPAQAVFNHLVIYFAF